MCGTAFACQVLKIRAAGFVCMSLSSCQSKEACSGCSLVSDCAVYSVVIARSKSPLALMQWTEEKGTGIPVDRAWWVNCKDLSLTFISWINFIRLAAWKQDSLIQKTSEVLAQVRHTQSCDTQPSVLFLMSRNRGCYRRGVLLSWGCCGLFFKYSDDCLLFSLWFWPSVFFKMQWNWCVVVVLHSGIRALMFNFR